MPGGRARYPSTVLMNAVPAKVAGVEASAGTGKSFFLQDLLQKVVFPEHFIAAFQQDSSDVDKNGRVSIWEAFEFASAGVKDYFERKGQLPTERPVLETVSGGRSVACHRWREIPVMTFAGDDVGARSAATVSGPPLSSGTKRSNDRSYRSS